MDDRKISLLMCTTVAGTLRAFLLPYALYFRELGWRVDAAAHGVSACEECVNVFDRVWEVEWSRNPLDPRNILQAVRTIRAIVTSGGYQLVHVHTPVASFISRYALRKYRLDGQIKVIYTAHGFHFHREGNPVQNLAFRYLEKVAGRWTDYIVVINREDEQSARRLRLVSQERIEYMPGIGVDTELYNPTRVSDDAILQLRKELKLSSNERFFLMVAEFIPRKRHEDALVAFSRLRRPDVHLVLAGEGVLFSDMKMLAERLGIQRNVHFLGFRRDVPVLMRAAYCVLLVSKQEGLPRSAMESLSLQTPVIGTDIRGISDLLNHECGLLIPFGDVERLASAMAWILDHDEDARLMGIHGRQAMMDYDLQNIVKLHQQLYNKALDFKKNDERFDKNLG